MSLARKNSILSKTINVDHSANGDTLFIPHSGIVNISGILTATSGNFSSQTVFASGSAAAPGISIIGDTDTGLCQISSVGTNSLSISTNGAERVRFASNGDVQINTGRTISGGSGGALFGNNGINNDFVSTGRAAALSAGWATLRVNQVAAYVGLRLVGDTSQTASYMEVENSSGTNLFTINSAGNVGIGTVSGRVVSGYKFLTINDTIGSYVDLLSNGTRIGELGAEPGSMTLAAVGASIPLILRTNDQPRITISADGNVGIGTSSPSALLEVAGSSKFTGAATFTISSGSSVPISIVNSGSGNSLVVATNLIVDGSGRLGFFGAPRAFEACSVLGTAPSSSQASLGFRVQCTYPSSTTTDAASFSSFPTTQAASYTLTNLYHFGAFQQAFGAGSTVTNQYGLFVDSTLTGATNNYAVYTGIASGTGRWAIYAAGTAASYFGGQVQISAGSVSAPGVAFSGDPDTGLAQIGGADTASLVTAGKERVSVTAGGNVGVGIASPTINTNGTVLHIHNGTASRAAIIHCTNAESGSAATNGLIVGKWSDNDNYFWEYGSKPIIFGTSGTEKMRIDASGNVLVGTSSTDPVGANVEGVVIGPSYVQMSRSGALPLLLNRKSNDGDLAGFWQDGAYEGSISVAGNAVSYNAFCGSHWAQLIDGSRPAILRGTVLETIDEMCEWPDGKSDRLPRVKVSDTPRSRRVYGVFMAWDEDYASTGDMYATALGAYMVRVSGVVQSGDLLESAGDGTARSQSDDIIRSSTIGKVSSTHRITEYDDGSYLVPCILMCG